jgi:hypothetical protein
MATELAAVADAGGREVEGRNLVTQPSDGREAALVDDPDARQQASFTLGS